MEVTSSSKREDICPARARHKDAEVASVSEENTESSLVKEVVVASTVKERNAVKSYDTQSATSRSIEKNTGPFASPFPKSLHDSFEMFHYVERTDHYGVIPRSNTHNGTKIYIHVGDKIAYDDTFCKTKCVITKFSRGCIHCTNGVTIPTDLIEDNNVQVWHFNDAVESFIQLTTDDEIFVQHNYNETRKLLGDKIRRDNAMWEEAQRKFSEVASEHNMPSPKVNFCQRRLPPQMLDDKRPTNERYYPINYLPVTMAKPNWRRDPRGSMSLPVKHAKCFICKQNVRWKIDCTMTCNEVINKLYRAKTPQEHTLTKHCVENKHCLFYFISKAIFDNNKVTTTLIIQRNLLQAINLFDGLIPLHYFKEYIYKKNPVMLISELSKVMGAAIAGMSLKTKLRNMLGKRNTADVASSIPAFQYYCKRTMQDICHALVTFDYTSLVYEGMSVEVIWNATNLFFRQGLYFDRTFPPLMFVDLESKEIADFN